MQSNPVPNQGQTPQNHRGSIMNHLMLGSQKANMLDMSRKGRINDKSLLNLRPGQLWVRGAGKISNKEILNGISQ
ncbi:hypothetical protein ABF87_10730 [Nitrosomonas sp. JL21]|nr:hypothetical protein [Nitrosomonas sp. JL21]